MRRAAAVPRVAKRPSQKQTAVDLLCRDVALVTGEAVEREHKFALEIGRKWRFDLAITRWKVAAEVNGGVFIQGRHSRGAGIEEDMRKLGAAVELGWLVIQCTPRLVKSGDAVRWIEAAVNQRRGR